MAVEHILKVPRNESEGTFIVINIKSNGPRPLDLALLATDGDSAWESTIKQSRVSKLRSKHSPIEGTEWEDVLSSVLLTQQYEEKRSKPDSVEKLELTSLVADDQLTVIVRRNISGITQRLGEITLRILDEEEAADRVELLDWVAVAVDRATLLENEVKNLNVKYEEQGRTIDRLNKQLEELIVAKNEHEASLLQNSQELLNAKKLKIRDQQRLLAGAKVDPQTAEQIQTLRESEIRRLPGSSGPAKRKIKGESPSRAKSESDEGIFEKVPSEEPELHNEETPSHSDVDATEDESEDEAMASAPPPSEAGKGRLLESRNEQSTPSPPQRSEPLVLPPRRQLPSAKQTVSQKTPIDPPRPASKESSPNIDANDSETSDDEL